MGSLNANVVIFLIGLRHIRVFDQSISLPGLLEILFSFVAKNLMFLTYKIEIVH